MGNLIYQGQITEESPFEVGLEGSHVLKAFRLRNSSVHIQDVSVYLGGSSIFDNILVNAEDEYHLFTSIPLEAGTLRVVLNKGSGCYFEIFGL